VIHFPLNHGQECKNLLLSFRKYEMFSQAIMCDIHEYGVLTK